MFCSKCGNELPEGSVFCPSCGKRAEIPPSERYLNKSICSKVIDTAKKKENLCFTLMIFGALTALLLITLSWLLYGRIYFFKGSYLITKIFWIAAILLVGTGFLIFVTSRKNCETQNSFRQWITAAVSLFIVLAVPFYNLFFSSSGTKTTATYSSEYIQNTFESCHTTAEHIQAIYSYDLNGDHYLSEYELELFFDAHPRVVNDKQFLEWVETTLVKD